ncbi:dTMP kinase [Alicyclobacillus mengziensis]|uniref:Thymidylate kinase n=1 Tax=Alicyclobacillus mengziensis TaxID=2931921 RepID=A0A9X7Z878_9BACL|nr:dTMP kinase [Alicyclobacillus mengziensis]QSO47911.1 dTMP kinase [Alicyclobacillus mengziensis]
MFITFEGLDGAGKSTQIVRLKERLGKLAIPVVMTREPGGTAIGDALRQMLLDPGQTQLSEQTETLLYAASRAQLLHEVIKPALEKGALVICDRYVDASIAYQGAGLGLGEEAVARVNAFATSGLKPDLTLLMDLPVETSQSRVAASARDVGPDRIEQRDEAYFERVRNAFMNIAVQEADRVAILDARLTPDELEQEIWHRVSKRLNIITDEKRDEE